ncbi:hypothetical protein OPFAMLBM_00336 [Aeromonas phage avDM12-TAAL]|nr:hypothetical protein OPFAMLBM_00336 [Aeromonas phage avDM12-TAAL]
MTNKQLMVKAIKKLMTKEGIEYLHVEIETITVTFGNKIKLSVRVRDHEQSERLAKLFRDQTNFSCSSTSSFKKHACTKVTTIFYDEKELKIATDFWEDLCC